ncbi:MAG: hypothetical protein PHU08_05955, partial [Dehalococcoidales bacterium]|nr:hypothetical protein [Dehalococcoidales bacterium]
MKRYRWEIRLGLSLLALSVAISLIQYLLFHDTQGILVWTMSSLAFLPISVLFVTLVMDRLLVRREKRTRLGKLNMVISAFFSEVGTELLTYFSGYDPALD